MSKTNLLKNKIKINKYLQRNFTLQSNESYGLGNKSIVI